MSSTPAPESARDAILEHARRAERQLLSADFRGYDPYDALTSPIARVPPLRSSRVARVAFQQLVRRTPINVRPLLRIKKGQNPVTIALVLGAYAQLATAEPDRRAELRENSRRLVARLDAFASSGFTGCCWGYDFPWQTRSGLLRAFAPTIVATGFVTNSLFAAYERLGLEEALSLCSSACDFVRRDLHRTHAGENSFCWSYSPYDREVVVNATAKGSRLLAQVYGVTHDEELKRDAEASLRFVAAHQREDGAWPYSIGDSRGWADNFHTGYVLDCLDEYRRRTGDFQFEAATERGWDYYRARFFDDDRIPRYLDEKRYPVDTTACAQSILTLTRFGDVATATKVALWTIEHMQRDDGAFAYRRYRGFRNSIPYARWSTAWMLFALSTLAGDLSSAREGSPGRLDVHAPQR